jgi:hypothetical protein
MGPVLDKTYETFKDFYAKLNEKPGNADECIKAGLQAYAALCRISKTENQAFLRESTVNCLALLVQEFRGFTRPKSDGGLDQGEDI